MCEGGAENKQQELASRLTVQSGQEEEDSTQFNSVEGGLVQEQSHLSDCLEFLKQNVHNLFTDDMRPKLNFYSLKL